MYIDVAEVLPVSEYDPRNDHVSRNCSMFRVWPVSNDSVDSFVCALPDSHPESGTSCSPITDSGLHPSRLYSPLGGRLTEANPLCQEEE